LREYLAAGSSVVSTNFPALDGYRDLITVADDADAFAHAMENYYYKNDHQQFNRKQRQLRVKDEGWCSRAEELKQVLNDL